MGSSLLDDSSGPGSRCSRFHIISSHDDSEGQSSMAEVTVCDFGGSVMRALPLPPWSLGFLTLGNVSHYDMRKLM